MTWSVPRSAGFRRAVATLCLVTLVLAATGCGRAHARPGAKAGVRWRARSLGVLFTAPPAPSPGPLPWWPALQPPAPRPPKPQPPPCPVDIPGFPCHMAERIREAQRYAATQPGTIGIVLHDRATGATWRGANGDTEFPAASTIKLAIVADLMLRNAAGGVRLSAYDRSQIYSVLRDSSDFAGDQLWFSYEDGSFLRRIERFGMRTASFSSSPPYWGFMYCSPEDLDNLMNYVLTELPAHDRGYIVDQLRHVAPIQQWGVWGAGPAERPGNKDGWEDDDDTWITDTVGFAGPHEKYTLAIMYDLAGEEDFHDGANALTQISALLFNGHRAAAPTAEPTP
jgi:hypothetical protein